jgi:hypothetical protein
MPVDFSKKIPKFGKLNFGTAKGTQMPLHYFDHQTHPGKRIEVRMAVC